MLCVRTLFEVKRNTTYFGKKLSELLLHVKLLLDTQIEITESGSIYVIHNGNRFKIRKFFRKLATDIPKYENELTELANSEIFDAPKLAKQKLEEIVIENPEQIKYIEQAYQSVKSCMTDRSKLEQIRKLWLAILTNYNILLLQLREGNRIAGRRLLVLDKNTNEIVTPLTTAYGISKSYSYALEYIAERQLKTYDFHTYILDADCEHKNFNYRKYTLPENHGTVVLPYEIFDEIGFENWLDKIYLDHYAIVKDDDNKQTLLISTYDLHSLPISNGIAIKHGLYPTVYRYNNGKVTVDTYDNLILDEFE